MFLKSSHNVHIRVRKESETLTSSGYEVTVLTLRDPKLPTEDRIGGAQVLRTVRLSKRPVVNQFVNTLRFIRAGLRLEADIYHANDLSTLLEAWVCARLRRKPLIYDSHELFTELAHLKSKPFSRLKWSLLEKFLIKRCSGIIAANQWRLDRMRRKYGSKIKKVLVLENWPDKQIAIDVGAARAEIRRAYNIGPDELVFIYEGVMNQYRGIEEFVRALARTKEAKRAKYIFVGSGKLAPGFIHEGFERLGLLDNLVLPGKVGYVDMERFLAASDIGLLLLQNTGLNNYLPASNKLYEYLKYGCAVLGSNFPPIEQVLLADKCGVVVYPADVSQIAKQIDWLIGHAKEAAAMGQRGAKIIQEKYNWQAAEGGFLNFYKEILAHG